VLDWEGLKKAGEFDPIYLHLVKQEALRSAGGFHQPIS
jgi:hypothetical protein